MYDWGNCTHLAVELSIVLSSEHHAQGSIDESLRRSQHHIPLVPSLPLDPLPQLPSKAKTFAIYINGLPPPFTPPQIALLAMKQEDIATTAAETFWKIAELRCELFKWQDSSERIGIAQLAKMMLLEKKSLPDVAEALYREATTVDLVRYLEERGCASVSTDVVFRGNG